MALPSRFGEVDGTATGRQGGGPCGMTGSCPLHGQSARGRAAHTVDDTASDDLCDRRRRVQQKNRKAGTAKRERRIAIQADAIPPASLPRSEHYAFNTIFSQLSTLLVNIS
jgi:hypothetical protein